MTPEKKLAEVHERLTSLLRLEGTVETFMESRTVFEALRTLQVLCTEESPAQRAFVHWDCQPCGTVNPFGMMCANCHGTMNAPRCTNGVPADAILRPDICKTCDLRPKCLWPNEPQLDAPATGTDLRDEPSACADGCGGCSHRRRNARQQFDARIDVARAEGNLNLSGGVNGKDLHRAVVERMTGPSGLSQEELKLDDGKVDWTILPFDALESVARVLMWAASRGGPYARESWREIAPHPTKGMPDARSIRSALRHIVSDLRGELLDPASQEAHLAHAVCQLLFAIAHRRTTITVTRKNVK